ncbi:MAG: hypothetical protein HXY18_16265 [Bryobacteraceae bacterium]|nr:hypothetical protein [Bryobacteraceae bacterium]
MNHTSRFAIFAIIGLFALPLVSGQSLEFREAPEAFLPGIVDSNSPALWRNGRLQIYTSGGTPAVSFADGPEGPFETRSVGLDPDAHLPMWIESVWQDEDGTVFAWYHHERVGVCPGTRLTTPMIGALISTDGGLSFRDLGIVISSGEPVNCFAENGYFANGHGDFTVVFDRAAGYFYFFFGAYAGQDGEQGVATARMAYADRFYPVGAVRKYYAGEWNEPALGGRVSPIFPAVVGWDQAATDSFWGPSVHWNTYLNKWVMLLNHACCQPDWPQDGIYISFGDDLSSPDTWSAPVQIIPSGDWYPQILGAEPGETDSVAGQTVRFYTHGRSNLYIVFHLEGEDTQDPEAPPPPEDPEQPPPPEDPEQPPPPEDPGQPPPPQNPNQPPPPHPPDDPGGSAHSIPPPAGEANAAPARPGQRLRRRS